MIVLRRWRAVLLLALSCSVCGAAWASGRIKILAPADNGSAANAVAALTEHIASPAQIRLDRVTGPGPAEMLGHLVRERAWSLAIWPADTIHAYLSASDAGDPDVNQLISPFRAIARLYNEEIAVIVRADSRFHALHDLRDARINVGLPGSSDALTAQILYRLLFEQPLPERYQTSLGHEDALFDLISGQRTDAVMIIGSQPTRLLAMMQPEARQYVRLLRFDASHPSSRRVIAVYPETRIRATNYPNLLPEDIPTIARSSYLVAYRPRLGVPDAAWAGFLHSWCADARRMMILASLGSVQDSRLGVTVDDVWPYSRIARLNIAECTSSPPETPRLCNIERRNLGLCE